MSNLLAKWLYKMTLQIHSTTLTDTRKKYEKFKNQKIQIEQLMNGTFNGLTLDRFMNLYIIQLI